MDKIIQKTGLLFWYHLIIIIGLWVGVYGICSYFLEFFRLELRIIISFISSFLLLSIIKIKEPKRLRKKRKFSDFRLWYEIFIFTFLWTSIFICYENLVKLLSKDDKIKLVLNVGIVIVCIILFYLSGDKSQLELIDTIINFDKLHYRMGNLHKSKKFLFYSLNKSDHLSNEDLGLIYNHLSHIYGKLNNDKLKKYYHDKYVNLVIKKKK